MGFFDFFKRKYSLVESGILKGTSDRHSHILYGVDDGIKTLEESLDVLAFEESLGVTDIWCTPHIMEDMPNSSDSLRARFEELCNNYKGPVKLHLAAEYMLDTLFDKRFKEKDLLVMDDDILLVETSVVSAPYDLMGKLSDIMSEGYRPLFAHPERCYFLSVEDCRKMFEMGVKFQLNIASLTGFYGKSIKAKAEELLNKGFYSYYGSDCHRLRLIKAQYFSKELIKCIFTKLLQIGN